MEQQGHAKRAVGQGSPVSVYLYPGDQHRLRVIQNRTGMTASEIVREAIRRLCEGDDSGSRA